DYSVPGVAAAMAMALQALPVEGELTVVAHSQGGFFLRALVHQHYDDLRWSGVELTRALTLAHPFFGKVVDPGKVTPWLCADRDDMDCRVQEWLWGWQNWLAEGTGQIDDTDFPQIEWTAVSGDGLNGDGTGPGGTAPEEDQS